MNIWFLSCLTYIRYVRCISSPLPITGVMSLYPEDAVYQQHHLVWGIKQRAEGVRSYAYYGNPPPQCCSYSRMTRRLTTGCASLPCSHCIQHSPLRSVDAHLSSFANTLRDSSRKSGCCSGHQLPHIRQDSEDWTDTPFPR